MINHMKNIIILFSLSLIIPTEINLRFQPELNISNKKIIDERTKDSQYDAPFQSFLLALDENQEIDLDVEIEKNFGKKINEIFSDKGEKYFRNKETNVLKKIVEKNNNFILATGGGTPCFNDNMDLINKNGISIFIDSKKEILVERINKNKNRPLFKGVISTDKKVSELYKERFKYYNRSDFSVNNTEEILSIINSYS